MGVDAWGGDDNINCTHDICDCCGTESGTDDFDVNVVRRYRQKWIEGGMAWFAPSAKPEGWKFEVQFYSSFGTVALTSRTNLLKIFTEKGV